MAELKTKKSTKSVREFLKSVPHEERRRDAETVVKLMQQVTKKKPAMWGPAIIGFDTYHYTYASGHEGDMCRIGLSPRKEALTLYLLPGYQEYGSYLKKLGPHKKSKGCLYIRHLSDIHMPTLKALIARAYKDNKKMFP